MQRCTPGLLLALTMATVLGTLIRAGCVHTPTQIGIVAYPDVLYLDPGRQQRFTVYGYDAGGNGLPVIGPIKWTSDGRAGAITPDGLFTAAGEPCRTGSVTATAPGGFTATARVVVDEPLPCVRPAKTAVAP